MRIPPCKDCPQRTAECHAACVSYARWRAQNTRQPPPDRSTRPTSRTSTRPATTQNPGSKKSTWSD
nr:MAG TPA_asm: hypothetical protein [Caudoviricetes sp.]